MTSETMKLAIQEVISDMMDRVMENVLVKDPFKKDEHHAKKPLYAALVPDEIFKSSHFERRFVTPFGKAWEKLAVVAANEGLGYGLMGHEIRGVVNSGRLTRITEVLNRLEHRPKVDEKRVKPYWTEELDYIMEGKGEKIPVTVMCDLFATDTTTSESFSFELKAPLPNSDQTKVSKEKILKLYCMEPPQIKDAYYALPYNPYGKREDYSWSFPARWFDMQNDSVVLIGDEFWEKIGGLGTYRTFINAVNEIGAGYRERIYREYLGIEPPLGSLDQLLI